MFGFAFFFRSRPRLPFAQTVLTFFSLFLFLLVSQSKSYAAENFTTDYRVVYDISEDGTAHSTIDVALTNETSEYYVSSYKVQLGFESIVNLQAKDDGGKITPKVTKTDNGQLVELTFNNKVVGQGKKQLFTLTFDTPNISSKQGRIWEINIPGIGNQNQFQTFDVELKVPASFGSPAYIKPSDYCRPLQKPVDSSSLSPTPTQSPANDKPCEAQLKFSKEHLGTAGISIAFGDKQLYEFALDYHLRNKNLFPIRTEIALPPQTNYQDVFIDKIDPEPLQVRQDEDGNWLAEFTLSPSQNMSVLVEGKAAVSLHPKKQPMTEKELSVYLQEKPYWQISTEKIRTTAKELKTPEAIYEYVIKTLSYDFSRVTSGKARVGAAGVLNNPESAVCLEFTDLFVALARAAGIPAREVNGFAFTENPRQRPLSLVQDILHAWPEYYDMEKQTWVMIDPTWGNTTGGVDYFHTLDFDHFTFVKKGMSSTYPIPAGGYKVEGDEYKKDVLIGFADTITNKSAGLSVDPAMQATYIAGLPVSGKIVVVNYGPAVSSEQQLLIASDTLFPSQQEKTIGKLLPFERKEVLFQFDKQPLLTKSTHVITMNLAGKHHSKTVQIVPFYMQEWKVIGGIGLAIITFIILIITIKTGRLRLS